MSNRSFGGKAHERSRSVDPHVHRGQLIGRAGGVFESQAAHTSKRAVLRLDAQVADSRGSDSERSEHH